jgi:hypothetical protein
LFWQHVWKCFDGAYSSSGSSEDVDGSVQRESNGSSDGEIISDDDVIAVDVQKAAEKPKTFGFVQNKFRITAPQLLFITC